MVTDYHDTNSGKSPVIEPRSCQYNTIQTKFI